MRYLAGPCRAQVQVLTRGRVYKVVYCIRCILYTLYSCIRCIRYSQAGTMSVRCIAYTAVVSLYRVLYRGQVHVESAQHTGRS